MVAVAVVGVLVVEVTTMTMLYDRVVVAVQAIVAVCTCTAPTPATKRELGSGCSHLRLEEVLHRINLPAGPAIQSLEPEAANSECLSMDITHAVASGPSRPG